MRSRPAKSYIARAVHDRDRRFFLAEWAAPGLTPRYVFDGDVPQRFNTAGAAENAAMRTLYAALNVKRHGTWSGTREVMSKEEFAAALRATGLSLVDAARILGSRPERINEWIMGTRPVPFFCWWALEFLRDPDLAEEAMAIAMEHTDETRQQKED